MKLKFYENWIKENNLPSCQVKKVLETVPTEKFPKI